MPSNYPDWSTTTLTLVIVAIGQRTLIVAYGNSLRALVKYLNQMPAEMILELNISTGIPLVYELLPDLRPVRYGYLNGGSEIYPKVNEGGLILARYLVQNHKH